MRIEKRLVHLAGHRFPEGRLPGNKWQSKWEEIVEFSGRVPQTASEERLPLAGGAEPGGALPDSEIPNSAVGFSVNWQGDKHH